MVVLTALGFYDDYAKIIQQTGGGTHSSVKLAVQTMLAVFIGLYLLRTPANSKLITDIMVPFYKYPILTGATVVGLFDHDSDDCGLFERGESDRWAGRSGDRLHADRFGGFMVLTYLAGNIEAAAYLQIPVRGWGRGIHGFCSAMIGAGLGFLWFNCHPAQMFMGDTGSLRWAVRWV